MLEPEQPQIHHLLVIEDKQGRHTIGLEDATCSIGRDPTNSIVLHSHLVSRQHAILLRVTTPENSTYLFRLIDGNLQGKRSTNGLIVNGQRCFSCDLQHGDVIVFGEDVKARYYATAKHSDVELLISSEAEDLSGFLSNLSNPFQTLVEPDSQLENAREAALVRLASFAELISTPILEIDLTGAITYLNPAATLQFPDIRDRKLQHPILMGVLSAVQQSQEKFFIREVEVADKVFEQSVHYIAESDLIRSHLVDVTQRKQVEEALRKSFSTNRALIDAMPDLMFRISKDGIFVNFKAAKHNNLLVSPSEFLGKSIFEVLPPEVAQPAMECVKQALQTGDLQIFEYQLRLDNVLHDYEARIVVSAEDEVMAIVRDITERKQAEVEIRNALEREKELSELKTRFVTMTSHEFRTPLTTILSSAELLEDYGSKWPEGKKLNHLRRIQTCVDHMIQLLNDVLLIGKAEVGKLRCNPAPLDLVQFCQDLVDELQISATHFQDRCSAHTLTFTSQCNCISADLDEKLLRHILTNLLSNAIKYSPQGGTVYLDLICRPGEVNFQVQDQGIGITAADQPQLFDSFYRASNVGTIAGTGLGLAIVKNSVDLHGGTITVESKVGVGTTFLVSLPTKQVPVDE